MSPPQIFSLKPYHVEFTADFSDRLCLLIESQGLAAAFYHFKGYSESEVIFTFHDAFEGEFVVSRGVREESVREFANGLGRRVEVAAFQVDLREQLRKLDQAMNPPWWRRAVGVLKRKNNA
jgi:hypothetical protein